MAKSDPGDSTFDAEGMKSFFAIYGSFLQLWQTFEVAIEVAIMKRLKLSARHTSIVLCSLGFQAKSNILCALLKEDAGNSQAALSAIGNAQTKAGRNDLTHSFLTHSDGNSIRLVRRDIKNGNYNARIRPVDVPAMHDHGWQFADAFREALNALAVSDEDVDRYIREIESHA